MSRLSLTHLFNKQKNNNPIIHNPTFQHLNCLSGRFPVESTFYNTVIDHFGSDEGVQYFILPGRKTDQGYEFAPFALAHGAHTVIRPNLFADSYERMCYTLSVGEVPSESEIYTFIDDCAVVCPNLAKLSTQFQHMTQNIVDLNTAVHCQRLNTDFNMKLVLDEIKESSVKQQAKMDTLQQQIHDLKRTIDDGRSKQAQAITYTESFSDAPIPSLVGPHLNQIDELRRTIHVADEQSEISASTTAVQVHTPKFNSVVTTNQMKIKDEKLSTSTDVSQTGSLPSKQFMRRRRISQLKAARPQLKKTLEELPPIILEKDESVDLVEPEYTHQSDPIASTSSQSSGYASSLSSTSTLKSNARSSIITNKKGVQMVKDINTVVGKYAVEIVESACMKPRTVIQYCQSDDPKDLDADIHVSLYHSGKPNFATYEGVLYATYHVQGCKQTPYTLHMIVKNDTNMPNHQGKNGTAIDFVTTRQVMCHLKYRSVYSNLASIPLIIDHPSSGFKAGAFAGRYGSFHRRWYSKDSRFYELSKRVTQMVMGKSEFHEIVEYAHHQMLNILSSYDWTEVREVEPLLGIDQIYKNGPSNYDILHVDKAVAHFGRHLPAECVDKLPNCITKCCELKEERHGLMHGAHVLLDKEKKFITPCGHKSETLEEYWQHPCTVRARTVALQTSEKSEFDPQTMSTSLRKGYPCSACGRRYERKADAVLCAVFCYLVQHGEVVINSVVLPEELPKVGAFGQAVNKISIPSALIL